MSWLDIPWSIDVGDDAEAVRWDGSNAERKRLPFLPFERDLYFAGEHPLRFAVSLFALYGSWLALVLLLPDSWSFASWQEWGASEQLSYFSALWSVQATVAALAYPIVIAFVAVFLQRRPAAQFLVDLYFLECGALPAGLSAMCLVSAMGVQYVYVAAYGASAMPTWALLDSMWFVGNVILTTWFLYRTVEFLRPASQGDAVRRYLVNVALPREVKRLYPAVRYEQLLKSGLLPLPIEGDSENNGQPKIAVMSYLPAEFVDQVVMRASGARYVKAIRLWPFFLVARAWMKASTVSKPPQEGVSLSNLQRGGLLLLPLRPGQEVAGDVVVARVQSGAKLSAWQGLLIRWAYVTSPITPEMRSARVRDVLDELATFAQTALVEHKRANFIRSYSELCELCRLLFAAALFENSNRNIDSWASLSRPEEFFARQLHAQWMEPFRDLYTLSVAGLSEDTEAFKMLCHLVQHLRSEGISKSPLSVRQTLLRQPVVLWHYLDSWWQRKIEETAAAEETKARLELPGPLKRTYAEAVAELSSGWEHTHALMASIPGPSKIEWSGVAAIARLATQHISETGRMLLSAVARRDVEAAEWLADVLANWFSEERFEQPVFELYDKTSFVTVHQLELEWTQLRANLELDAHEHREAARQRGLASAAIKNLWLDVSVVTATILTQRMSARSPELMQASFELEIAVGVLSRKRWRAGNEPIVNAVAPSAPDFLDALVRQMVTDERWGGGYSSTLDEFVRTTIRDVNPPLISSRIYGGRGGDDVHSLLDSQLDILVALSMRAWKPSQLLLKQAEHWTVSQNVTARRLASEIERMKGRLEQRGNAASDAALALCRALRPDAPTADCVANVRAGLDALLDVVMKRNDEAIAAADLDQAHLKRIGVAASAAAFGRDTGAFPLHLFRRIESSYANLEEFTLRSVGQPRGEFTSPVMAPRAINEGEFWAETMTNQVAHRVLDDVLRTLSPRERPTPDAEAYVQTLTQEAKQLSDAGQTPILVVENPTLPEWLWAWQTSVEVSGERLPEGVEVRRQAMQRHGYVCHLNGIAVYAASIIPGRSLLVAQEAFDLVRFQEFGGDSHVKVSVVARTDSNVLVDLLLTFAREVKAKVSSAVYLVYDRGEPAA